MFGCRYRSHSPAKWCVCIIPLASIFYLLADPERPETSVSQGLEHNQTNIETTMHHSGTLALANEGRSEQTSTVFSNATHAYMTLVKCQCGRPRKQGKAVDIAEIKKSPRQLRSKSQRTLPTTVDPLSEYPSLTPPSPTKIQERVSRNNCHHCEVHRYIRLLFRIQSRTTVSVFGLCEIRRRRRRRRK